ncbi:hypothetical protein ACP4OV_023009 [Aristida adscensionis]
MAEVLTTMVVGPLVSIVKEKASSYLLDQYKVMEGMEEQREVLERKLPAILDVIEDAEKKGSYRPGVNAWLKALKKVSYEAIDVFDEFKYEALRRDAKKKGHYKMLGMDVVSLFPAHNPIAFRYRMGKKLRRIVQTIEILVLEMNTFGLIHRQQVLASNNWRQTDSILIDSEMGIVGRSRAEEMKKIVNILLHEASNRDLLVLPIVGMGGLGKTTFVQLVYNDPEIKKHFDLQRWCCVSDEFHVGTIASNICGRTEKDLEKALQDLQEKVSGKKYLIVLDDVWNRDADKWAKLKSCLQLGGKGSAILVTTRDLEVGRVVTMGTAEVYNLEKLGEQYLKEIILSRAFSLPKSNKVDNIIHKMVDRCHGSPLAAKAFGSMLSNKTSMHEWKDILARSKLCDEKTGILPVLKLSYDHLPSYMKQCFAFCAVFPKDYEIDVESLIQLWMAHDFIPLTEDDNPEIIGKEIFKELVWRSFFQDVKQSLPVDLRWGSPRGRFVMPYRVDKLRGRTTCKIHDLMHDIALSVMANECITIVDRPSQKRLCSSSPVRHLFSSYYEMGTLLDEFLKKKSPYLRTLLYPEWYTKSPSPYLSMHNSVRALQLFELRELPLRPRNLQHLRYLDLSRNSVITELPEELSILYNLQTLKLTQCRNLRQLPKGMKYMASLQHLYTYGCESLKDMPPDLGQLTSLQILTSFVVGDSSGCSTVRELQKLNLGGELEIRGLDRVTEDDAREASIPNKEMITHLSLVWGRRFHSEVSSGDDERVLDALKPNDSLQMLRIINYKGTILPRWMEHPSLQQHLTVLHLDGLSELEKFPRLYDLKSLQVLHLLRLQKLQSLCSEVTSTSFPALKELHLYLLESLERLAPMERSEGEEPTFPMLEDVIICSCPKLRTLPVAPKLNAVEIMEHGAHLSFSIIKSRYMSSLSKLSLCIQNYDGAETLQLDQNCDSSLSEILLDGCDFLFPSEPTVGLWKWFGRLVQLTIESCNVLVYWPEEEFRSLVSLKILSVNYCDKLIGPAQVNGEQTQTRDQLLPHLNSLRVRSCKTLVELFTLPPSVTSISVSGCPRFEFIWRVENIETATTHVEQSDTCTSSEQRNEQASTSAQEISPSPTNHRVPCLESLYISECGGLVMLPDLPLGLKFLYIRSCPQLRSVSGKLDVLRTLYIKYCNSLESLHCLGSLPSLEELTLKTCKCLASLPGDTGSYAALKRLKIKYCPSIEIKSLYKRHQQRLDGLEIRDLSNAHSSDPKEGPKLSDPKSWKYAIPGCGYWGFQHD